MRNQTLQDNEENRMRFASPNAESRFCGPRTSSLPIQVLSVILLCSLASCTTTQNHGRTLKSGEFELKASSMGSIYSNALDLQFGLTDQATLGASVRGVIYPSGELYAIYGWNLEEFDLAASGGIVIDPIAFDRDNKQQYFPWISPSTSLAISKRLGDWRPYANTYFDYWKAQANLGLEWEIKPFVLSIDGFGSYFYNDWGPVNYKGQGIVINFKRGSFQVGVIPVISLRF